MWKCFLIGWGCFVLLVYVHLIFDYLYYYKDLRQKLRNLYRTFTEE